MPIETISIQSLSGLVAKFGPKVLYPGFPFFFVPALVAGLIGSQFIGSLTYFPNDRPAALDLPVSLSSTESQARKSATLLVVPGKSDGFFMASADEGISTVWLSIPPDKLPANLGRVNLKAEGLGLDRLRGVDYPVVVMVEGSHKETIDPISKSPSSLPKLQLSTPASNWIVLFLLGAAVFGCGASTGFFKDEPIEQK